MTNRQTLALGMLLLLAGRPVAADDEPASGSSGLVRFLGGAASGLVAHELGHVTLDLAFGVTPDVHGVSFHGIPFFAISPGPLPPGKEYLVASNGFLVQHVTSEWLFSGAVPLRERHAPFDKGWFAFNVGASFAYAGAAFARTGPVERDTRGMASATGIDERWIGALVLAPALLDSYRYFHPRSRFAPWTSRALKLGMLLLVAKAAGHLELQAAPSHATLRP